MWLRTFPVLLCLILPACCVFTDPYGLRNLFVKEVEVAKVLQGVIDKGALDQDPRGDLKQLVKRYLSDQSQVTFALPADLISNSSITGNDDLPPAGEDQVLHLLVGDPLQVYKLISRIVQRLPEIANRIEALADEDDAGNLDDFLALPLFPEVDKSNLVGASLALARIQQFYQSDPFDMAFKGILPKTKWPQEAETKTSARLSAQDCIDIADKLVVSGEQQEERIRNNANQRYAAAIEWYEAALRINEGTFGASAELTEHILDKLAGLWQQHDDHFYSGDPGYPEAPNDEVFVRRLNEESRDLDGEAANSFYTKQQMEQIYGNVLTHFEATPVGRRLRTEERRPPVSERVSNPAPMGDEDEGSSYWYSDYYALCRGETLNRLDRVDPSSKICKFEDRGLPHLLLAPLKLEIVMPAPQPVFFVHDILSDAEIEEMLSAARDRIARARVDSTERAVTPERTQNVGWLDDGDLESLLPKLSRRLDAATGLRVSRQDPRIPSHVYYEAEPFQIGVYAPGGLYLPHLDAFPKNDGRFYASHNKAWVGNRIATAMIYLSDDVLGGATVFPQRGVSAFPRKGSVLIWHNLTPEGRKDNWSIHAGCPTIKGIKWVSNKWIREGCQIFNHPCPKTKISTKKVLSA